MSYLAALTFFHTAISLVAIVVGLVVVGGLLGATIQPYWTTLFLVTAIVTSATGYLFPVSGLLPSHIVGAIALVILAIVLLARYSFHLAGAWRWIYAAGMVASLYFLAFVGVVQAFLKIPALHALAPNGNEAPFAIAQVVLLVLCIAAGIAAARSWRPMAV
ncbi:hypothetical protein [Terrarubrum flagellatum]|uniref:hypothetical protein n=1 Tax=Terrirubrum flagellatum TaxID=2895980 RepID=UPI003145667F